MSNLSKINVVPERIGHILTDRVIKVPINQRDFSWEVANVKELYDDFEEALSQNDGGDYFLGSIVVLPDEDGESMEVVDGQQRLASVLIFYAAIRDFLQEELKNPTDARDFEGEYIFKKQFGGISIPRMTLNERDNPFFKNRVLLEPQNAERKNTPTQLKHLKPSHRRIERAAKAAKSYVRKIVENLPPEKQRSEIKRRLDFLNKNAQVIWVEVPDESSAYVIFETMNDRGLELSASDLIKNLLFARADNDLENVKAKWFQIIGKLDKINEPSATTNYIRHYWMIENGVVRVPQLFGAIKKKIKNPSDSSQFIESLVAACQQYVDICEPTENFWKQYGHTAKSSMEILGELGIVQIRPLILAMLLKDWKESHVMTVLNRSLSWAIRLLAARTQGTGPLEQTYSEAAFKVNDGTFKTPNDLSTLMEKSVSNDEKFKQDFMFFEVGKPKLARYYLQAMEKQENDESEPYFVPNPNAAEINLEHVMPQERGDDWKYISEEEHETYVNRMGNLALMKASDNASPDFGNKSFSVKVPIYKKSKYILTKELSEHVKWNAEAIDARQKRLSELAAKTWPLRPK